MFERFAGSARQAVAHAGDETRELRHDAIGTEHLLLGLLCEEDGAAARVLGEFGLTLDVARESIVRIAGRGEAETVGSIAFTPRAVGVLERAARETPGASETIDAERLLLALAEESEGLAARLLAEAGADAARLRTALMHERAGRTPPGREEPQRDSLAAEPPDISLELGWRPRGLALAALGAGRLARQAFDRCSVADGDLLQTEVLVCLALVAADQPAEGPGDGIESIAGTLACDPELVRASLVALVRNAFVVELSGEPDARRFAITGAGVAAVDRWLTRVGPLFERWPPDTPDVDDATG
jgi:hypothetical protein